jgi:peptidyl-tRNA hydrolase
MSKSPKQVILVRRDLRLKRAAVAALVAKASSSLFVENDESDDDDKLVINLTSQELDWIRNGTTRIVLGVSSENTLRSLIFKSEMSGLSCYPVTSQSDDGMQEMLCAAVGPDDPDKIDEITRNLKLL